MHWPHSHSRRVRLLALLAVGAAASVLMTPRPAHAYVLWNVYWQNNGNIQYCESSMTGNDTTAFNNALGNWNGQGLPIHFSGGSCGVHIFDENDGANGYTGYTSYSYGSTGCNGWGRLSSVSSKLNPYYTNNEGVQEVQSTAAHELGHALGLGHTSDQGTLMYPNEYRYINRGVYTPQADDRSGISYIYNSCGGK